MYELDEAAMDAFTSGLRALSAEQVRLRAPDGDPNPSDSAPPSVAQQLLAAKAEAHIASGRVYDSEAFLTDLNDLVPSSASLACLLARARRQRGDLDGALASFTKAVRRAYETTDRATLQRAYMGRAEIWLALGRPWMARLDLESAAEGSNEKLAEIARRALSSMDIEDEDATR
jgi:tetratricopeptide (TPR) repeat protein